MMIFLFFMGRGGKIARRIIVNMLAIRRFRVIEPRRKATF